MNRILLETEEIHGERAAFGGNRADHVVEVLKAAVGHPLKTGEVNGGIGTSEITGIEDQGPGRRTISIRVTHDRESPRPWIDLVLAPPRPRVLKRLLPQLTALGVGRIVLVGARKVEKDFWGATLLKEENYRPLLIEGLMQAGSSILPELLVRRNFRAFLNAELEMLFPTKARFVAHPAADASADVRCAPGKSILLAVGPEGGWTEQEVALLEEHDFARYSLGPRILRTDTALVAVIAQLMKEVGE